MTRLAHKNDWIKRAFAFVSALSLLAVALPTRVGAAELVQRSVRVSDARAAQNNVTYRVGFSTTGTNTIGSIAVEFCSNSPLVDDTCIAPAGFDASGVTVTAQNGMIGFNLSPGTTNNRIVLGRPPQSEGVVVADYTFHGVVNPFTSGSYYARIYTYPTSDGTGSFIDAGGLAMNFLPALGVSAEVPPYLKFCVGESISGTDCSTATEPFSDLGILSPLVTSAAQTQMVAATNAESGYSLWVLGGTMTSGNNTIPALASGGASQKGVGQFGINLRANTNPIIGNEPSGPGTAPIDPAYGQQNQYRFKSGDTLASVTAPDDYRKFTVSYIVNVPSNQPGGVYATTLTYVVLANF